MMKIHNYLKINKLQAGYTCFFEMIVHKLFVFNYLCIIGSESGYTSTLSGYTFFEVYPLDNLLYNNGLCKKNAVLDTLDTRKHKSYIYRFFSLLIERKSARKDTYQIGVSSVSNIYIYI